MIVVILVAVIVGVIFGAAIQKQRLDGMTPPKTHRQIQAEEAMKLFEDKDSITNDDVEQFLSVSDATATRVLDAMEAEGLVVAKGKGKGTYYVQK